jgi:hypothetical protein
MSRVGLSSDTRDRTDRSAAAVAVLDADTGKAEFIDPGAGT